MQDQELFTAKTHQSSNTSFSFTYPHTILLSKINLSSISHFFWQVGCKMRVRKRIAHKANPFAAKLLATSPENFAPKDTDFGMETE
jgi:hypothetical protein